MVKSCPNWHITAFKVQRIRCTTCFTSPENQKERKPHLQDVCLPDSSVVTWCNDAAKVAAVVKNGVSGCSERSHAERETDHWGPWDVRSRGTFNKADKPQGWLLPFTQTNYWVKMCEFRIQDGRHSPWRGLPQMAPWHHVGATIEITLDKNGSLYDPAGTESWNVQIRYETIKLTMHPTQQHDSLFNSSNWVLQVHIRTSPDASPENVGVFVGSDPTDSVTAPCIEFRIRKGEDKGRKRERSFTSIQMLHTHTRPEPGQPWKARGRKKRTHEGQTAKNSAGGGGEQTDLRNQPTRRNGPDQNSAHT